MPLCFGSSSCCRAEVLPESRILHYSCPTQILEIPAVALSPFSWESWHKAAHQRAYNKHLNICLFIQTAETWGDLFITRAGSHTIEFEFPPYSWWKAWTSLGPSEAEQLGDILLWLQRNSFSLSWKAPCDLAEDLQLHLTNAFAAVVVLFKHMVLQIMVPLRNPSSFRKCWNVRWSVVSVLAYVPSAFLIISCILFLYLSLISFIILLLLEI